ncbi:MAG: 50S ribosomal protein L10 [Thermodesulfobacteriota bacterium]
MQQKEDKKKIIDELAGIFQNPVSVLVIEYRGLDVKSMQSVRRQVKQTDAELRVIKNKFLVKACEGTEVEKIKDLFQGPTAIAICGQESPATAKVFTEARKEFEKLLIKGGIVEGKVCGAEEIEKISKLPSRQILISMFASVLATPMSNFANSLEQMRSKLLFGLEALKQTKDGGEEKAEETGKEETKEAKAEEAQEAKTEEVKAEDKKAAPPEKKEDAEKPAEGESEVKAAEDSPAEKAKATKKESSDNKKQKEENSDG